MSAVIFLVLSINVQAVDKIVSNSADWKDVYSTMLYASLIDKQPGLFLTSTKHGTILPYSIPLSSDGILVVSSRSQPYTINYKSYLESLRYNDVEEIVTNTANLDLAERLVEEAQINKFIIVDDAYGYNALSAASYAVIDNYYVLFVSERNIGPIDSFLEDVDPEKVIIFGQVDEVVKTRLAPYNPETINEGDRFDNNIEMVKRYVQVSQTAQLLMSNGEFIEASIMSGDDPVLFIGRGAVPQQVKDYVSESDFQVAVLIGNELINSATEIRRQLGLSVFVKFAQGSRTPSGPIATVEDLDKFPMPRYSLDLAIYSIVYNRATNSLWVTYKNNANIGTYLKGTITITNNGERKVVGDAEPVFIDKNQYKTLTYDIVLEGDNITANLYTLFGEGRRSLENVLEAQLNVESIEILDAALINITDVSYDRRNAQFIVTVENIGTVDSYVSIEALDLFINGEYITVSSPEAILLKVGEKAKIPLEIELTDADIENNPIVKIKGYYGERENSLIKTVYGEYAFKFKSVDYVTYALILLIIILLLLILFGRKKCPHCGYKNSRIRKTCKNCGNHLYRKEHKIHQESTHKHHMHSDHNSQNHVHHDGINK
jgi:archaellum component FlaF (FlaF/FlaG flagellin family)